MMHHQIKRLNNVFKVTIMLLFASLYLPLAVYSQTEWVDRLIQELRDESWRVRAEAAKWLGEIGDSRAIKPLIAALKDEDQNVQAWVAWALGKIGTPAVEPLIAALKDEAPGARWRVVMALWRMGDRAVEPLIAALKHEDKDVRRRAAEALGEIKDPRAVEPLIAALKDKDGDLWARWTAAEALAKIGRPALEPLQLLMSGGMIVIITRWSEEDWVRRMVTWALRAIEGPRAVEPLITKLDKEWWVRGGAARALIKIGKVPVEPLIAALKDDESSGVRRSAARALGWIKDPRAVEPLIVALKDENRWVRGEATEVLKKIGTPAVEPLIAALKDEERKVRERAAEALKEITGKDFGRDHVKWQEWWERNKDKFLKSR